MISSRKELEARLRTPEAMKPGAWVVVHPDLVERVARENWQFRAIFERQQREFDHECRSALHCVIQQEATAAWEAGL